MVRILPTVECNSNDMCYYNTSLRTKELLINLSKTILNELLNNFEGKLTFEKCAQIVIFLQILL